MTMAARVALQVREKGPVTEIDLFEALVPRGVVESVRSMEVLEITSCLARLEAARLVERCGSGPTWRATSHLKEVQDALQISLNHLASPAPMRLGVLDDLVSVRMHLAGILPPSVYRSDLMETLREIEVCLEQACHVATLAMAGKVCEMVAKVALDEAGKTYDDRWTLGKLMGELRQVPGLRQGGVVLPLIDLIHQSRNGAVHAQKDMPLPSRDDALSVVHAMIALVRRRLCQVSDAALP